jgi:hypothetical protein
LDLARLLHTRKTGLPPLLKGWSTDDRWPVVHDLIGVHRIEARDAYGVMSIPGALVQLDHLSQHRGWILCLQLGSSRREHESHHACSHGETHVVTPPVNKGS